MPARTLDPTLDAQSTVDDPAPLGLARTLPEPAGATATPHVGRYEIGRCLGVGGMGAVYEARDPTLDRTVALKVLRDHGATDIDSAARNDARLRLLREAQAMAKLRHPNVVTVFEAGETDDGEVYVAMELVDGGTLRAFVVGKPWRAIVGAYLLAGRGLAAAHALGIMHRDFKPDNVLVGSGGRVLVGDFGLARAVTTDAGPLSMDSLVEARLTQTGAFLGTPAYMAPEQFAQRTADARTDQFGFCVALWEALYGARPFLGASPHEIFVAILTGAITPPVDAKVPRHVERALLRGLATRPADRWPGMDALLAELARDPARTRRRVLVGVGASLAAAAVVVGWVATRSAIAPADPCAQAGDGLDAIWSPTTTRALSDRFAHASLGGLGPQVVAAFDRRASAWRSIARAACVDTRVRAAVSEPVYQRQLDCLADRRDETRALLDQLPRRSDAELPGVLDAVDRLPDPGACRDTAALAGLPPPPRDPSASDAHRALAEAHAAYALGRYVDAAQAADRCASSATALAYAPLRAEALTLRGLAEAGDGHADHAEETLRAAALAADEGRADNLRAMALVRLIPIIGGDAARKDEARRLVDEAQAVVTRVGDDDLAARLDNARGLLAARAGDADAAIELMRRAAGEAHRAGSEQVALTAQNNLVALLQAQGKSDDAIELARAVVDGYRARLGPHHPEYAHALTNLAIVLYGLGKSDDAAPLLEEALAVEQAALGPDHPDVAQITDNLAEIQRTRGKLDEAAALAEASLASRQRRLGDHPDVASAWLTLSAIRFSQHRFADARDAAARAVEMSERLSGVDHPDVADALTNQGAALNHLGQPRDAVVLLARAVAIYDRTKAGAPTMVPALTALGAADDAAGDPARAIPLLERALRLATDAELAPASRGEIEIDLADALAHAHRDPARADGLARAAIDHYLAAGPGAADDLAEVRAWLVAHPSPPR